MSDCVPDFHEMEDDCDIPAPTSGGGGAFSRPPKKSTHPGEEEVMELMWQNGPVIVQRSSKKVGEAEIRQQQGNEDHLFMQEDEMASWLQYPIDDSDFYADILFSNPAAPPPKPEVVLPRANNFPHFSRMRSAGQSAVVESNVTPAVRQDDSRVSNTVEESLPPVNTESGASARDLSRKRKEKAEADDSESQSEDIEFEATETKKQAPGSSSTKRSRAAEVHNLSERRRRDRINEKMRALQELIPRCNKSDKASMLDEAIEYLKSLQMQVQMMSMGYGIMPMMYPGMQQYMPAMGMGMGMGMSMDMGMNRPIVPYPSMVQGSGIPGPAAAAHMGPRYPMPAFHMPSVRLPDPSRLQVSNQADPMLNSLMALNSNQPRMPNFVDPYQQFLGLQQAQLPLPPQAQLPLPQNQVTGRTNTTSPGARKETGGPGHPQTG